MILSLLFSIHANSLAWAGREWAHWHRLESFLELKSNKFLKKQEQSQLKYSTVLGLTFESFVWELSSVASNFST